MVLHQPVVPDLPDRATIRSLGDLQQDGAHVLRGRREDPVRREEQGGSPSTAMVKRAPSATVTVENPPPIGFFQRTFGPPVIPFPVL